jgi:signal transduction histidine kinase
MFEQILNLVGEPPGSLVYHFITLFAVEAALAIAFGQWLRDRDEGTGRLAMATLGIGLARAMLLLASLLAWQGYLPRNAILPPIERAVDAITALGLAWAFITMDDPILLNRNLLPDAITSVLLAAILAGYAATGYFWLDAAQAGALFNGTWIDVLWAIAQIAILAFGLLWMLFRIQYAYDPFLKGAMLVILAASIGAHLVDPGLGDVAAAVRLGQVIVMPALAALSYRHVVEKLLHWDAFEPIPTTVPITTASPFRGSPEAPRPLVISRPEEGPLPGYPEILAEGEDTPLPIFADVDEEVLFPPPSASDLILEPEMLEEAEEEPEIPSAPSERSVALDETRPAPMPLPTKERERPKGEPALLEVVEALEGLFTTSNVEDLVNEIARSVATALRSDIALFITVDEENHKALVNAGYDNIAQSHLPEITLPLGNHPTIVNALGRVRQLRITPQRDLRELNAMYSSLGITHAGPTYVQPLTFGDERIGVVVVGCPYSDRLLSNEERTLLGRLAPLIAGVFLRAEAIREAENRAELAVLQESSRVAVTEQKLESASEELSSAQRQIQEMGKYIRDIHRQIEAQEQEDSEEAEQTEALIGTLTEENEQLKKKMTELQSQPPPLSEPESLHLQAEPPYALQAEIASLRARLATAAIAQQEILFLQEQLAVKAREAISLRTRLTEAQAVADAMRSEVGSVGDIGPLQSQIAAQATEISRLQTELAEAQANAALGAEAMRQQEEAQAADRDAVAQLQARLEERSAQIEALEAQLAEKMRATTDLKAHMSEVDASLKSLEAQLSHKTEEVEALQESLARQREEAQGRIAALQAALDAGAGDEASVDKARVEALEAELEEKSAAAEVLEEQLAQTSASVAALEARLSETNAAVEDAISEAGRVGSHDEVIAAIAQELRTPMSSIVGYTDLVLNEEIGILGSLQRDFLQRVRANIVRMGALLDDLIHITMLDSGSIALEAQRIDALYTLEEAIADQAPHFREKSLTLRLAAPERLPPITADRDALYQIMSNLLSNAALASPENGEIQAIIAFEPAKLFAPDGTEYDVNCLHLSVEDSGGGIAEEDVARVFARKYRTDHPLIEGLGDTGVGLALAKTLVDIHGGRIWVETEHGVGSIFHILLPIQELPEGGAP